MDYGVTYPGILGTIGRTPLIALRRIIPAKHAQVSLKCEFFNPLSSVKDRIGLAMVDAAERSKQLLPNGHIIEPTSGNTGIALAFVAAAKGYRITLAIPESMSVERRALLRGLGADFHLTPAADGMRGAVAKAEELFAETPRAWMPRQFENPANPHIHRTTTGPELWIDSQCSIDIVVAGVGTGGTITGVTSYLRERNRSLKSYAVEPTESPVISGGKAGKHGIQGIGPGFIPVNLEVSLLNGVETVSTDEAYQWARRLAVEEGIPAGISTGANVAAAARIAARPENAGRKIVTFASSSAERYLSTPLYQLVGMSSLPPALVG